MTDLLPKIGQRELANDSPTKIKSAANVWRWFTVSRPRSTANRSRELRFVLLRMMLLIEWALSSEWQALRLQLTQHT
jgi:hypothetical protein